MNPSIDIWIRKAEDCWLGTLVQVCRDSFGTVHLPSHDHSHHFRVWTICKHLMVEMNRINPVPDYAFVEATLIAALFHDVGMAVNVDPSHGKLGREACEAWLGKQKDPLPARISEALEAIEFHDRKDETLYTGMHPGEVPEIMGILSVADDLDALGHIGIYRYAEIYLKRDIPLSTLGISILRNASMRFNHISKTCSTCPGTLRAFHTRYSTLVTFFDNYNQQLLLEAKADQIRSGYVGVINLIRIQGIGQSVRPEHLSEHIDGDVPGRVVRDFFYALQNDLKNAHRTLD